MLPEKSHVNSKDETKIDPEVIGGGAYWTRAIYNRTRSNVLTQHNKQYSERFTSKPKIAWEEMAHSPILQFALINGWKEGSIILGIKWYPYIETAYLNTNHLKHTNMPYCYKQYNTRLWRELTKTR